MVFRPEPESVLIGVAVANLLEKVMAVLWDLAGLTGEATFILTHFSLEATPIIA